MIAKDETHALEFFPFYYDIFLGRLSLIFFRGIKKTTAVKI